MATGTIVAPVSSARRPMPGLARSASEPSRERPPSQYIAIQPPRSRIVRAVIIASSSRLPRCTGNTPPCVYTHCIGLANIWDLAMNCTLRLSAAPRKKWSMNEKWFGARITGPLAGTSSGLIGRSRTKVHAYREVAARTVS